MRRPGSAQSNVKVAVGTRLERSRRFRWAWTNPRYHFRGEERRPSGGRRKWNTASPEIFRCRWAQRDDGIVDSGRDKLDKSVYFRKKDGGVQLPVASVRMTITIVKASTNASDLDNFRIYPDNMASINGQAIGVHLDVSSTTKVVTCIAFDMSSWICTKRNTPMAAAVKVEN